VVLADRDIERKAGRMITVDKEIIIQAPLEKIFNFVIKPSNLPQIWPSLIEIKDEQSLPNGRYSAKWVYKMAGIPFRGTSEVTDIIPNCWFTSKTWGAINSTITWTFRAKDGKTRVTVTTDYQVPVRGLNRLAEPVVVKMNEQEANLMLTNLRVKLEDN
jgi:uncharacterized membrane protein